MADGCSMQVGQDTYIHTYASHEYIRSGTIPVMLPLPLQDETAFAYHRFQPGAVKQFALTGT
jgi:hypothetical protein